MSCLLKHYRLVELGTKYTIEYAAYFYDTVAKSYISPFHDIPLYSKEPYTVHMVTEIPRWSNAKLEINTKTPLNPIKQDVKKGKPRFVHNLFPYHGYPWNYGALPQTWEDPDTIDHHTQAKGDNDPVDVIEIGSRRAKSGDVMTVRVVGCIALIDEGETDWKIIAINTSDPLHDKVTCLETLNQHFPGFLDHSINWCRNYKVPAGSKQNTFAFEGVFFKDRDFAMSVIAGARASWEQLVSSSTSPLSLSLTTDQGSKHYVDKEKASELVAKSFLLEPSPQTSNSIPEEVDEIHYVNAS